MLNSDRMVNLHYLLNVNQAKCQIAIPIPCILTSLAIEVYIYNKHMMDIYPNNYSVKDKTFEPFHKYCHV